MILKKLSQEWIPVEPVMTIIFRIKLVDGKNIANMIQIIEFRDALV